MKSLLCPDGRCVNCVEGGVGGQAGQTISTHPAPRGVHLPQHLYRHRVLRQQRGLYQIDAGDATP